MRPQRDPALILSAVALLFIAYALYMEAQRRPELVLRARAERQRALEAEELAETRRQQLDGALETITELRGGQPASEPAE